jgi:hypothetical protein
MFDSLFRRLRLLANTQWLAIIFLLCALPTGLACALLTPIGEFPDEPQHIARADGLRYGQIIGFQPREATAAGVMINVAIYDVALAEFFPTVPNKPLPEAARQKAREIPGVARSAFAPRRWCNIFQHSISPLRLVC